MTEIRIVVIAGPTASGKSALAQDLAEEMGAEIVSADSMQVYKGMDIGTAKPTHADLSKVAHHLIDVVRPDEPFTAATYLNLARQAINDIAKRGKQVIVSGGTGLYIRALTDGLCDAPTEDKELRARLLETAEKEGSEALHRKLTEVDPDAAARIHSNNVKRVVRALEVFELTGRPLSEIQAEHAFADKPFQSLKLALERPREVLYKRIEERTEQMLAAGLEAETRKLLKAGYSRDLKPMQGLGYKEMVAFINNEINLDDACKLIKKNTRNYAKRQITWFKGSNDFKIFDPDAALVITDEIKRFLL
jgi:tRNA dimethylallyltransferase